MYFGNYRLQKTWLRQCLKSPVSEYASKSNMLNAPKHCSHLIVLQKVHISDMKNLKTVS